MAPPTLLRDVLLSSSSIGSQPITAAFTMKGSNPSHFALNAIALFRGDKLVGYAEGNSAIMLNSLLGKSRLV
ncbi:hypothetical protein LOK74_13790 [Brevibacillus humidisoli]|uniref:hypothetical protein n=1 Tax=Brevibacillus humidisoli TaxID=2895522 RepID=UPI001E319596|nr:hypothetical protein [Brevibacillus humidisoli]UFJ39141.1 hypothetical protein LOK74_13790 [Brevibacillus humidisoli]